MIRHYLIVVLTAVCLLSACGQGESKKMAITETDTQSANSNCARLGGQIIDKTRGDGSPYKICVFTDNRQCETIALFLGHCPKEGRKITGYDTDAAIYCVVTGGIYDQNKDNKSPSASGNCVLNGGKVCNALALFEGTCSDKNS